MNTLSRVDAAGGDDVAVADGIVGECGDDLVVVGVGEDGDEADGVEE